MSKKKHKKARSNMPTKKKKPTTLAINDPPRMLKSASFEPIKSVKKRHIKQSKSQKNIKSKNNKKIHKIHKIHKNNTKIDGKTNVNGYRFPMDHQTRYNWMLKQSKRVKKFKDRKFFPKQNRGKNWLKTMKSTDHTTSKKKKKSKKVWYIYIFFTFEGTFINVSFYRQKR